MYPLLLYWKNKTQTFAYLVDSVLYMTKLPMTGVVGIEPKVKYNYGGNTDYLEI